MRIVILIFALFITGCTTTPTAEQRVQAFYEQHLIAYADFTPQMKDDSPLNREYVASDTLRRIAEIHGIYEQEILSSDYFTYTQDYSPDWVDQFQIASIHDFMDGKVAQINIGIEEGKTLRLEVYLLKEASNWKIYRVRNISDNDEQSIFDDHAIAAAKDYAAAIK